VSRVSRWERPIRAMPATITPALAAAPISLSGGQRQRVLVAQGLAQDSDLLLLDEPAAGLDMETRLRIDDVLAKTAAEGVTVVAITHDLDVAARAGHCLLLRNGRLVGDGPPSAVLPAAARTAWS